MNEFDIKAKEWDMSAMHRERAETIAGEIIKQIPLSRGMRAMEFGAGTGLLSFILKDHLKEITLIDNSEGMLKVLTEKVMTSKSENLKIVKVDLGYENLSAGPFDLIFSQMVLHHVEDIETIIRKFHDLLNPGGYIAIADLYSEDGSFHGEGFNGHPGFDPVKLSTLLGNCGFKGISHRKVYVIDKKISDDGSKKFDVFLMTAVRN